MIRDVNSTGRYVNVSHSPASHINGYSGSQGVGNMRFNTVSQNIEVYDGNTWITLYGGTYSVGLNHHAEELLDWAQKKRDEELEWSRLSEKNHAVQVALENLNKAKRQLDVTIILSKEHND